MGAYVLRWGGVGVGGGDVALESSGRSGKLGGRGVGVWEGEGAGQSFCPK